MSVVTSYPKTNGPLFELIVMSWGVHTQPPVGVDRVDEHDHVGGGEYGRLRVACESHEDCDAELDPARDRPQAARVLATLRPHGGLASTQTVY